MKNYTVLIVFKKPKKQKRIHGVVEMWVDNDFMVIGYYKYIGGEMPDFKYEQALVVLDDIQRMVIS